MPKINYSPKCLRCHVAFDIAITIFFLKLPFLKYDFYFPQIDTDTKFKKAYGETQLTSACPTTPTFQFPIPKGHFHLLSYMLLSNSFLGNLLVSVLSFKYYIESLL